ncbi:Cell wall-active antibiotics response 4TMS YvqF [Actinacidiphila glaucinigra]|uniref:Cell wall-active antibiotics response 4TMS YvqF n=1 Tax=Actinacidiphila glaucinigra TaxID=235986 RepID=A0A239EYV4_9ACTN|nr:Cell wall-active antibiotics response 4TMS YvqF [Actinacidiphila glaucinigra]
MRPVAEADIRASDADRDRVADILRDALAEGRLTTEEHSERLDGVYAAKTVGELEPYVRDLPAGRTASAPAPSPGVHHWVPDGSGENPNLIGILGGAERKGRWRVGSKINAVAILGGVVIDLTEATFTSPELVINCTAIMGGVEIKVPENVTLHGGGVVGIMGGSDVKAYEAPDPNAPVIKVQGFAFWGGVEAKPRRGKRVKKKGLGPAELDG